MEKIEKIVNQIMDEQRGRFFNVSEYQEEIETLLQEDGLAEFSILHTEGGEQERMSDNYIDTYSGLIDVNALASYYNDSDSACHVYLHGSIESCNKQIQEHLQDSDDEETLELLEQWSEELKEMKAEGDKILVLDLYEGWETYNKHEPRVEFGHDVFVAQAILTDNAGKYIS